MGPVLVGVLQLSALMGALALVHAPLGNYLAKVCSSDRHRRVEKWIHRGIGADPDTRMRWPAYLRGLLAFSLVGVLFLYAPQRLQGVLPGSLGFASVDPDQAFNTAVSFLTNTNWQWYSGEQTMGHLVQTAGLAVQNFVSAAVGIAVAVALYAGSRRHVPVNSATSGPTWSVVSYAFSCRWPSSRRSCSSRAGSSRTSPGFMKSGSSWVGRSSGTGVPSPRRRPSRNSAPTAVAT